MAGYTRRPVDRTALLGALSGFIVALGLGVLGQAMPSSTLAWNCIECVVNVSGDPSTFDCVLPRLAGLLIGLITWVALGVYALRHVERSPERHRALAAGAGIFILTFLVSRHVVWTLLWLWAGW